MKGMTRLFIILYVSQIQAGYSQALSLEEIFKCKDYICFSEQVIDNGFSLIKATESEDLSSTTYLFASNKNIITSSNSALKKRNTASITTFTASNIPVRIGFRTADVSQYQKLLSQMKAREFKVGQSVIIEGSVQVSYKSAYYPNVEAYVNTDRIIKNRSSWTSYHFVFKIPSD